MRPRPPSSTKKNYYRKGPKEKQHAVVSAFDILWPTLLNNDAGRMQGAVTPLGSQHNASRQRLKSLTLS